jgi:hypothetical protein
MEKCFFWNKEWTLCTALIRYRGGTNRGGHLKFDHSLVNTVRVIEQATYYCIYNWMGQRSSWKQIN